MGYIRAEEILPADVIKQIQQYVDGANIYIPRKQENRLAWGTKTAYRHELQKRDKAIYNSYLDGKSVNELAHIHYLSEKSIQRIIRNYNKENQPLQ